MRSHQLEILVVLVSRFGLCVGISLMCNNAVLALSSFDVRPLSVLLAAQNCAHVDSLLLDLQHRYVPEMLIRSECCRACSMSMPEPGFKFLIRAILSLVHVNDRATPRILSFRSIHFVSCRGMYMQTPSAVFCPVSFRLVAALPVLGGPELVHLGHALLELLVLALLVCVALVLRSWLASLLLFRLWFVWQTSHFHGR